jgi:hypothetical protein
MELRSDTRDISVARSDACGQACTDKVSIAPFVRTHNILYLFLLFASLQLQYIAIAKANPNALKACDGSCHRNELKIAQGQDTIVDIKDKCWEAAEKGKRCVAKSGFDKFGLPKKEGWIYRVFDDGAVSYMEWDGKKEGADGYPEPVAYWISHEQKFRYAGIRFILRRDHKRHAKDGEHITSLSLLQVVDCKEGRGAIYSDGKLESGWFDVKNSDKFCMRIPASPLIDFKF